jgi:hypothetical protein
MVLRLVRTDASQMKKHIAEVILAEAEPDHIRKVLEYTQVVVAGPSAAAVLRVKKTTLYFHMHKLGICWPGPSSPSPRLLTSDRIFIAGQAGR